MHVRRLALRHFRNYAELDQGFSPCLNVIWGDNAQGKTSLVEAVGLLATTKSIRGSRDEDLIAWDYPAALATVDVARRRGSDVELEICLSRTARKSLVVDGTRTHKAMEFVGQLKVVAFSVADLEVVRGEPVRRRRFLDLEISQLSPAYCHALSCYRKVLEQRNRLLKEMRSVRGTGADETLAAWTSQLVQHGARLVKRRRQFITRLDEMAGPLHDELSGELERLSLVYQPSFRLPPDIEDETEIANYFQETLRGLRQEEAARQVTLAGPHRDDLLFLVNGRDARFYGSQGQQRTAMLSTRLAEIELMKSLCDEPPVCLLDDVFSELDPGRRSRLLGLQREEAQVFLTTTDPQEVPAGERAAAAVLKVEEGRVLAQAAP